MPKMPWMKWFPGDWWSDPGVALLSLASKAVWFELLQRMSIKSLDRGLLRGSVEQLALLAHCDKTDISRFISENEVAGVALVKRDRNGIVTVANRRMLREENVRTQTSLRVRRYRQRQDVTQDVTQGCNAGCNADVTQGCNGQRPEARGQMPDSGTRSAHALRAAPAAGTSKGVLDLALETPEITTPDPSSVGGGLSPNHRAGLSTANGAVAIEGRRLAHALPEGWPLTPERRRVAEDKGLNAEHVHS